jgi:pRiA4b ORF-3-like protein
MSPSKAPANDTSAADSFNQICTVRIELLDTDPLIWREVEVPTSITLKVLHDIVQITMGWLDYHLWEFTIGKQTYGLPTADDWGTAPRIEAIKTRPRDVLEPRKTTIDYMYDFGDSWAHRLTVTGIRPGKPGVSYPHYIGGEWDCPPEDCGGIPGFYNMLDALADPGHPDHGDVAEYLDGWDPKEIDELPLRIALSRIANRRNAARTRIAKKANRSERG